MTLNTKGKWFYFQAVFQCHECGRKFSRVVRVIEEDHFVAMKRLAHTACEVCKFLKGSEVEILSLHQLPLQHLEEYMSWT